MSGNTLNEIRRVRLEKINKLVELGFSPFPAESHFTHKNSELIEKFDSLEGSEVVVVGRLMSLREHGALSFGHLRDSSGDIQLFLKDGTLNGGSKSLGYNQLSLVDVGDFLQVSGKLIKTSRGEISVEATTLVVLTKSVRPLPEKWEGVSDPETRFRKRYLEMIMDPSAKELFLRKAKFWKVSRQFLSDNGFVEVETPIMEHVTGGADAKPFVTHHNALDEDFYLRISTELYQKRLISAGFEKIYTLGPNFRNEGIDDEHLQEYYQVEWYWAYATYRENMELVKNMFRFIAENVYGKTKFTKGSYEFDLSSDWPEIDYRNAVNSFHKVDIENDSTETLKGRLKDAGVFLDESADRGRIVDHLWKVVRKTIAGPAFLVNHPVSISPLAKSDTKDPTVTQRFQVIIAGTELGNGYSELNDPTDQYRRFLDQQKARDAGDDEAQMMDIDYVEMLEYGMPPTSGYGQSERVFWFLENVSAREGTIFPQMKRSIDKSVELIYPEYWEMVRKLEAKNQ
jgi:lysyl-tRNA synthetase, class II